MARPSIALLDRDRIADAALRRADRTGQLTVVGLASDLGVAPSALYHHVQGRDEIIALMRERMSHVVDTSAFQHADWREALRVWADSYRRTFARWPGIVGFMATQPVADRALHPMYEDVVQGLEAAGFPKEVVLTAVTALENFVLGSVLDLATPDQMLGDVDADSYPDLHAAAAVLPRGPERADQAFRVGLEALIFGFSELRAGR